MAEITFYEKPGCINGEKQKKILTAAGHTIHCKNILETVWTRELLEPFFLEQDPVKIMNYTAPDIKKGKIIPDKLSYEQAISLMIDEPILIKRPLIQVDGTFIQGFTKPALQPYLGNWNGSEDVITCPNLQTLSCDEKGKSNK